MTSQPNYFEDETTESGLTAPLPSEPGGWIRPPKDWGDAFGIPWTFVMFLVLTGIIVITGLILTKTVPHYAILFIVLGFILAIFSIWPKGGYLDWWLLFPYIIVGWALYQRERENPIS